MDEQQNNRNNSEPSGAENSAQRIPAPVKSKKKLAKRVGCVLGAVGIAAASFGLGALTNWLSIDEEWRTMMSVKKKIDAEYYESVSDEQFFDAIFSAINNDLLDPYSEYMTAEEFAANTKELAGSRAGLGLVFRTQSGSGEKQMLVTRVCGNSPAEAAGITAGSYLVGFGEVGGSITESVDYNDFTAFLQDYGAGEKFMLKFMQDGTERVYEVSREEYTENYVFYRSNTSAYAFTTESPCAEMERGDPLSCLSDDTAYIRLVQFTGNATSAFSCAMERFAKDGKQNLVLDLRGNGGGYLSTMQAIASYFCKSATASSPVAAIADYGDRKEYFYAKRNLYYDYFTEDSRICVLADGDSASASECLLGCMIDYGAVGYDDICLISENGTAKTYGKGIMQSTFYVNYAKKDAIKLTTAKVLWPLTQNCIHGVGVVAADGTVTTERNYRGEEELIAAINALG